jgi:hypothetical protein
MTEARRLQLERLRERFLRYAAFDPRLIGLEHMAAYCGQRSGANPWPAWESIKERTAALVGWFRWPRDDSVLSTSAAYDAVLSCILEVFEMADAQRFLVGGLQRKAGRA